ncbi:iron permease [Paenibacillus cremeus]|uniref:Iron permease n=2 Tax=Paenibacillus cremeus TaxID=2163881 RepID=A0A559KIV5_9BACL|nr:iron permease [Paenibacillus cremeus]
MGGYNALWGFLASSAGLLIGGTGAGWVKGQKVPLVFSLCAGMIIGLVVLDIVPDSIRLGGWPPAVAGLLVGVWVYSQLERWSRRVIVLTHEPKQEVFLYSGVLIALSIAIHNVPTGIALGANASEALARPMLLTIFFHTIPEGIAVFTPLIMAGYGLMSLLVITLVVSLPIAVGALIGGSIGLGSPLLLTLVIALAMGMTLAVAVKEMLGKAVKDSSLGFCAYGAIAGFVLMATYLQLVSHGG